ncbi:MAG: capsule biosynthesis protein CapA, partial [Pseudodonghicola sp.]
MGATVQTDRVFLFLQGPHGPFFNALGEMLRATGATVWRAGFNAGDRVFWRHPDSYIPHRGSAEDWPETLERLLDDRHVTDIVLYGDTRPIHATAVAAARARGLTVHVFEEGYMRPYWITYERGGSNGNSRLMDMTIAEMQSALALSDMEAPLPPASWGDMRQHVF